MNKSASSTLRIRKRAKAPGASATGDSASVRKGMDAAYPEGKKSSARLTRPKRGNHVPEEAPVMSKGRSGAALVSTFAVGGSKPASKGGARASALAANKPAAERKSEASLLDDDLDGEAPAQTASGAGSRSVEAEPTPDVDLLGEEDLETELPPLDAAA